MVAGGRAAAALAPAGRAPPVSAIAVSILLGLAVANALLLPAVVKPGLDFAVKKALRLGIVLVGIKLSFFDVLRLGGAGAPVVAVVIAVALGLTIAIAGRLGVSRRLGVLAAASTSICGVTAALSVAPAIDAEDREVAYTVANVTLFGMLAMLLYPYLAHAVFAGRPAAAGLFLGTAIHDTSQAVGAALAYRDLFGEEAVLKAATITKLTRNCFLVVVVPALALYHARATGAAAPGRRPPLAKLFPTFVLGFLAMAVLRTIGDAAWEGEAWRGATKAIGETAAGACLGTAMAAVGLTTSLTTFRGLGLRPLYVGASAALLVGALAMALAAVAPIG
jgi:uncharacterized integral membrane protein (TIGR00698 family)